jgi:hypothetical protein
VALGCTLHSRPLAHSTNGVAADRERDQLPNDPFSRVASEDGPASPIERFADEAHIGPMGWTKSAVLVIAAMAIFGFVKPAPLLAQAEQESVLNGHCQYSEQIARHRNETTLILCDTATIKRAATSATFDFRQRSWGSMAQFAGDMAGDKMTVSRIALRDGRSFAASGTCEISYRNDGGISAISCLGGTSSRSIAANFIPSRL